MPLTLPSYMLSTPADFLRASEAGASLGLQAGQARIGQQEAQQRQALAAQELFQRQQQAGTQTQLSYDQMSAQERHQQMALQAARERAAAALYYKQQQQDMLNQYRYDALGQRAEDRQDALSQRKEVAAATDAHQKAALALQEKLGFKKTAHVGAGGEITMFDPESGTATVLRPGEHKASTKLTQRQAIKQYDIKAQAGEILQAIKKMGALDPEDQSPENQKKLIAQKELVLKRKQLLEQAARMVPGADDSTPTAAGALDSGEPAPSASADSDPLGLFK